MRLNMEEEKWLPVVGYEGLYEVSDRGRVRSLDRDIEKPKGTWRVRGVTLSQNVNSDGYAQVGVSRESRSRTERVHRLVATAFLGPAPFDGAEVNHKDLNKLHNTPGNLEWLSHQENMDHANANGRGKPITGLKKAPKNTPELVEEVRRLGNVCGLTPKEISEKMGVRISSVWVMLSNKVWTKPGSEFAPRRGSAATHRSKAVKLTVEQVTAIRSEYVPGVVRQVDLAKKYGVDQSTVSTIIRNATWWS